MKRKVFLDYMVRMRSLKAVIVAVSMGAGAWLGVTADAPTAKCVHCPSYACHGGGTCNQCSCMRRGSAPGQCVSLQDVESYAAHGYSLVP